MNQQPLQAEQPSYVSYFPVFFFYFLFVRLPVCYIWILQRVNANILHLALIRVAWNHYLTHQLSEEVPKSWAGWALDLGEEGLYLPCTYIDFAAS